MSKQLNECWFYVLYGRLAKGILQGKFRRYSGYTSNINQRVYQHFHKLEKGSFTSRLEQVFIWQCWKVSNENKICIGSALRIERTLKSVELEALWLFPLIIKTEYGIAIESYPINYIKPTCPRGGKKTYKPPCGPC